MANGLVSQLFGLLQGLQTDTANLHKSLDDKDEREETGFDLSQVFSGFSDLQSIMSKLNESDVTQIQAELKKLMSGQEDILEYSRDITNILAQVKKRTEQHAPTKDKVIENMPPEAKEEHAENVGSMFNSWGSIIGNVSRFLEQNTAQRTGSR